MSFLIFKFRPKDFADKLTVYSDWSFANDDRSHNIPLLMKHYFCNQAINISSESTGDDDFPYHFNYEERNISKELIITNNGKSYKWEQLAANCCVSHQYGSFSIQFDVIRKNERNTPSKSSATVSRKT